MKHSSVIRQNQFDSSSHNPLITPSKDKNHNFRKEQWIKSRGRWLRDKTTSFDYIFELGKGRINILQTILMFATFVKVYSFSSELTYIMVGLLLVAVFIMGFVLDKAHIPDKMADEKEKRSPFMKKMVNYQKEILDKLNTMDSKNAG